MNTKQNDNLSPTEQIDRLSRNQLETALVSARNEFKPIEATGVGAFNNPYATKFDLLSATNEALIKNNINHHFYQDISRSTEREVAFILELVHAKSGQKQKYPVQVPMDKKGIWAFGSAMTYAFRYLYADILGLEVEVNPLDDDGQSASNQPVNNSNKNRDDII